MKSEKFAGEKILLLGSGGLRISQAGEFDYSGSQAIKALKEENKKVILVNPNIATVQTDSRIGKAVQDNRLADEVYLQPLDVDTVTEIIRKEKPDGVLLGFGGQTALNLGLALEAEGIFKKYNVKVLGTTVETIRLTEDRALFKEELEKLDINTAKSVAVDTVEAALAAAELIGYPVMMRSGFSLGGLGSGIVKNAKDLQKQVHATLQAVPQILIEENLIGWSEFEYEIIRDSQGNGVTICNMENMDPMGIHTGESIVIAPSQSLNNEQYHYLRKIALVMANHFNIVGECNVQYAVNLKTGDYRVIEINPRLSRSSALASKATGYPLAFVAAKLALGWQLHEIKNAVTGKTCAFFEPALDYVVIKIPKWDTHKLKSADRRIGTEMKSVGEVMSIGRTFKEALQKAIGMLEIGADDISHYPHVIPDLKAEIQQATDRRLFALFAYFYEGGSVEEAYQLSGIDCWFLRHVFELAELALHLPKQSPTGDILLRAKKAGFSDRTLANWYACSENKIREMRLENKVIPYVKQVDTLAGEFAAQTNYLYLTYHGIEHDVTPSEKAVVILGSGPYSIGSSVEFDWCAVNTSRTLRTLGEKSIIINSNPETVSTDYDESDRLYFETRTLERVRDIVDFENPKGIIVSMGGQVANNLAFSLAKFDYPILGTPPESIDNAEDRARFSSLLNDLNIDQPEWACLESIEQAAKFAETVGYPVLIRPSYVLSGAAMNVVYDVVELARYLKQASKVSPDYPVVISKFIEDAKELEIDGVASGGEIVIHAISEHVENAGVHSGDATIVLPPQNLYLETIRRTKKITQKIVKALKITGPFNIQFIAKNNEIRVIECNLRASRSFPFVSKVTNYNFVAIATEVIMGVHQQQAYETLELEYVGVKTPQFSYNRLKGANPVAHVEMASTGEVACLGDDLLEAFFRSWQATEQKLTGRRIFLSIASTRKKLKLLRYLKILENNGWELYATRGTHDFLAKNGVGSIAVYKMSDRMEPGIATLITERRVDLIVNIPHNALHHAIRKTDGFLLRRMAIDHHIPLITNLQSAQLFLQCLVELDNKPLPIKSWREFVEAKNVEPTLKLSFSDKESA